VAAALTGVIALFAAGPLACGDDTEVAPLADGAVVETGIDAGADGADARVVARGARVLGLTVDITDPEFPARVDVARDAGATTTGVTFAWDEIERPWDGGQLDLDAGDGGDDASVDGADGGDASSPTTTLFNPGLHIVNLVLDDRRFEATLALEAFDVGGSRAPADLWTRALDDAQTLARYDALLDYAFDQMHDTSLTALVVASGADALLDVDAQRAMSLAAFVDHVRAHARAIRPDLKVGFTIDRLDRAAAHASELSNAWAASDFIGIDDVPSAEVVSAKPQPSVLVPADFARMTTLASRLSPAKPILLRQAGYPSSQACGSDEATQAAFVDETFRAWDTQADRVFAVVFRELDDLTPDQAAALAARRGRSDAPFLALLQSLGMRAAAAREKSAFGVLRRDAHARGW
jgi:hypothetical protein